MGLSSACYSAQGEQGGAGRVLRPKLSMDHCATMDYDQRACVHAARATRSLGAQNGATARIGGHLLWPTNGSGGCLSRRRKSTIYDIAVAADLSPTTVSLVLNDSWQRYRIKPETAARILSCAENLGYAVNLKARGLRLSQSGLAGMILPHYRNRFFAGLAEAFEANARSRGLCPIVVSTHRNPENEAERDRDLACPAGRVSFLFGSLQSGSAQRHVSSRRGQVRQYRSSGIARALRRL